MALSGAASEGKWGHNVRKSSVTVGWSVGETAPVGA